MFNVHMGGYRVIFGAFLSPICPKKYVFAKINPTIIFSAKNYYTHLYWATLAHSEYLGTYFFRFGLKIAIFRAFLGPCMATKKIFFAKMDPTIIFSAKNYYSEPL